MKHYLLTALCAASMAAYGSDGEPDAAKVYAVADAHLDTQWNWDVQTTIRDHVRNTLTQNLFLLSHYPEYVFNFEGAIKYNWMKEYYPHEYEMMKKYITDGRWHISGASWDATDVIVPSVESQIRSIMLGQNFYRDEFGVESTDIFLPDCFGFGWTLPTIANHCGLIGFSSQKLDWRQKPFFGNDKLPFTIGLWQGVDGAKIMFAHGYDYGRKWDNVDLSHDRSLIDLSSRTPLRTVYRYYGTGDIGGSPTIGSVESVMKGIDGDGPAKIISATSDMLFEEYMPYASHPELPVYDGELLMDVHGTGCYTSQAAMKLYNRQNEQLGDAAERAAVLASLYAGADYPAADFTESWRRFIWHQFHDDLTGTSIPRAYEFSWNDELLSLKQFAGLMDHAIAQVASTLDTNVKGTPVVLYNPLGYGVRAITEIYVPATTLPAKAVVRNEKGAIVPSQIVGYDGSNATLLVEADMPSIGVVVYDVVLSGRGKPMAAQNVSDVENSVYKIRFDPNGDIASLIDKRTGKQLVNDGSKIRLALFPDNKSHTWPAWEVIKATIDAEPVSISDNADITLVEDGNLRKRVKVSKTYGDSQFVQYINLYEGSMADRIDFDNKVDWATTNALVKAEFPLSVSNPTATYDLGIGVATRGNNTDIAYEVPAQQWADLTNRSGSNGVTVLTDSKYGWDKPDDNTIRLTLLHTPQTRNNYKYQDHQDLGHHQFTYSIVSHDGDLRRADAVRHGERLNQKIKGFVADKHKGTGRSLSLASTDQPNVVIKALKGADSGQGYVVRVYETSGQPTKANITFNRDIATVHLADGTEKVIATIAANGNSIPLDLPANGIATIRVDFNPTPQKSATKMASVALPYNNKAFTWNEFRSNGTFPAGYTYAAELIPETLIHHGINYNLMPNQENNALIADGDTIALPDGNWTTLHILAASPVENGDTEALLSIGGKATSITVPSFTGFVGQWGHTDHTTGYLKPQDVAYVGTHRHSHKADEPYEFTYMYHYAIDIPRGASSVVMPAGKNVAIFAATVSDGDVKPLTAATIPFKTGIKETESTTLPRASKPAMRNVLSPELIVNCTGFVNDREKPEMLVDGDENTKWCDAAGFPSTIDFDLGVPKTLRGWRLVNAAHEDPSFVTAGALLMGRNSTTEDWKTIDFLAGNSKNVVNRTFSPTEPLRYLRLMVTSPMQDPSAGTTRIYELAVYE